MHNLRQRFWQEPASRFCKADLALSPEDRMRQHVLSCLKNGDRETILCIKQESSMSDLPIALDSLDCIKRYAKSLKKDRGIKHAEALNQAPMCAGYANFAHAQRSLKDQAPLALKHAPRPRIDFLKRGHPNDVPEHHISALVQMVEAAMATSATGVADLSLADVDAALQDRRPWSPKKKRWLWCRR